MSRFLVPLLVLAAPAQVDAGGFLSGLKKKVDPSKVTIPVAIPDPKSPSELVKAVEEKAANAHPEKLVGVTKAQAEALVDPATVEALTDPAKVEAWVDPATVEEHAKQAKEIASQEVGGAQAKLAEALHGAGTALQETSSKVADADASEVREAATRVGHDVAEEAAARVGHDVAGEAATSVEKLGSAEKPTAEEVASALRAATPKAVKVVNNTAAKAMGDVKKQLPKAAGLVDSTGNKIANRLDPNGPPRDEGHENVMETQFGGKGLQLGLGLLACAFVSGLLAAKVGLTKGRGHRGSLLTSEGEDLPQHGGAREPRIRQDAPQTETGFVTF